MCIVFVVSNFQQLLLLPAASACWLWLLFCGVLLVTLSSTRNCYYYSRVQEPGAKYCRLSRRQLFLKFQPVSSLVRASLVTSLVKCMSIVSHSLPLPSLAVSFSLFPVFLSSSANSHSKLCPVPAAICITHLPEQLNTQLSNGNRP